MFEQHFNAEHLDAVMWLYEPKACFVTQSGDTVIGRDDGQFKVYGIDGLRIADASVMPRVTTGNTMAPCVVIGERAAEILQTQYKLQTSVIHRGGNSLDASLGSFKAPATREGVPV